MFQAIMLSEAMYAIDMLLLIVTVVALVMYFKPDKPQKTLYEIIRDARKKRRWK